MEMVKSMLYTSQMSPLSFSSLLLSKAPIIRKNGPILFVDEGSIISQKKNGIILKARQLENEVDAECMTIHIMDFVQYYQLGCVLYTKRL